MRFQLNDEQRALQDAVRSWLRDKLGPEKVREVYEDPDGEGIPPYAWQAYGEQGWLAVLVPEKHDGVGLGLLEAAVIARNLGAGTAPGPWLGTVLAGEAVRLYGSDEQQAALLPQLAAGSVKGAVALLKPGAAPTPSGAPALAKDGALTGVLELVEYGAAADTLVVAAQDGLYLVDPSHATVTPHQALDRTTRLTTLTLDAAPGERLEGSGDGWQELLDRAAVLVASDLAGIARRALTDTVEYDKTRVQFGKPVGSFQALQHALADVHLTVTMAEYAATYAAHALDIDAPGKQLAVSVAKAKTGDAANAATSAMIQFLGGIGFTWEHHAHFYLKRAKRLEYAYGDASQHRERIAQLALDVQ
ncbi:MAG: acyl-CoA/acyl-ACP dehydrogenase [Actinomycetota bacterium]|nr:acyl-CoA/acyl-ACP dehydrogenase [Actinomycetota bacterium]